MSWVKYTSSRLQASIRHIAADTPDTPKQIEAAVIAIVIGLLMMALGVLLL